MVSAMEPMYKSDKRSMKRGTVVLQWLLLTLLFVHPAPLRVVANSEVEALRAVRRHLIDPAKVLQSWDPDLINPCTYFHVTCNSLNQVIRIDLGNAELSGKLRKEIARLPHLQYLELYGNYISGKIPIQLGKLSNLVSLDLYENNFTGTIPATLGKLQNLRFLRLNNNALHGKIPVQLTTIQGLQDLDLSNNSLSGEVPTNGSFSLFGPSSFEGNEGLCGAPTPRSCPISEPPLLAPIAPEPSTPNT